MSFKLIDSSYTGPDAAGGTEVTSFDMGSMFWGQEEEIKFFIGNTDSAAHDYTFSASGVNSGIIAGVEFSLDNIDWETSVTVSGVIANGVSDLIYAKLTMPSNAYINSGTWLINIGES